MFHGQQNVLYEASNIIGGAYNRLDAAYNMLSMEHGVWFTHDVLWTIGHAIRTCRGGLGSPKNVLNDFFIST